MSVKNRIPFLKVKDNVDNDFWTHVFGHGTATGTNQDGRQWSADYIIGEVEIKHATLGSSIKKRRIKINRYSYERLMDLDIWSLEDLDGKEVKCEEATLVWEDTPDTNMEFHATLTPSGFDLEIFTRQNDSDETGLSLEKTGSVDTFELEQVCI